MNTTPLSSLAPGPTPMAPGPGQAGYTPWKGTGPYDYPPGQMRQPRRGTNWAWIIIVFIIVVIIVWLILWALKPAFVQKTDAQGQHTGEVDNGKALLWAIIIAIIICIIIWIISAAARC